MNEQPHAASFRAFPKAEGYRLLFLRFRLGVPSPIDFTYDAALFQLGSENMDCVAAQLLSVWRSDTHVFRAEVLFPNLIGEHAFEPYLVRFQAEIDYL
jgi:hypothetical protein